MKKSKIPKLCHNIGLGELFLEKILSVRIDFYFTRAGINSVRKLLHRLLRAPDHTLLKNRLKIKQDINSIIIHSKYFSVSDWLSIIG